MPDDGLHRRDRPGGLRTQLDLDRRGVGPEQAAQRHDRGPGAVELVLEALQVVRDQGRPDTGIGGPQDPLHIAQGDVEFAEPVDDLRGRDLVDAVVAVTGGLVHHGGFQQGRLVIPTQGPHAQMGQPRELPDGQHPPTLNAPPGGESTA